MTEFDNFDNVETFAGLPVLAFDDTVGLEHPDTHAYRLAVSWDDDDMKAVFAKRLAALLASPRIGELQALVIGQWGESMTGSAPIVERLLERAGDMTSLRALFFGDISQEESEISWIENCDHGPLLRAFPKLETYVVRGGNGLDFTGLANSSLRTLVVQTGGLPKRALHSLGAAELPALRHLELWLGVDEYGFDGGLEDLKPYIDGTAFAALSYLGLRNSDIIDEIARALPGSPRFGRLATLDLSNGTLTDEGGEALLLNADLTKLEKLDLHHHFLSDAMMERLRALDLEIDLDEQEEAEDFGDGEVYRYVAVSE